MTPVELVRACAEQGNAAAWQEFIHRFQRVIATVAYRVACRWGENDPAVVDDLVQETYLKLYSDGARILREFEAPHPGAIYGFLKVLAANVATDHFKRLHTSKRGGGSGLLAAERAAENIAGEPAEVERALLIGEIDSCLRAKAPAETRERDCTIFSLYYRHGLTAKEIAALPSIQLGTKGVESTLHRLVQLVKSHLAERRKGREGFSL